MARLLAFPRPCRLRRRDTSSSDLYAIIFTRFSGRLLLDLAVNGKGVDEGIPSSRIADVVISGDIWGEGSSKGATAVAP